MLHAHPPTAAIGCARFALALCLLSACARGATTDEFTQRLPPQEAAASDAGPYANEGGILPSVDIDAAPALVAPDTGSGAALDAAPPAVEAAAAADSGGAALPFTPSNLDPATVDAAGAPEAMLNCGVIEVDTSEPVRFTNWCGGVLPRPSIAAQAGGAELVVVPLAQLAISAGSSLRVKGARPLVLLVGGDATIAGSIDVSARGAAPGPGGDLACAASAGGDGDGDPERNGGGGGGGGFGTRGGQGGDDSGSDSAPGLAGAARGNAELVPLLAGCGGGRAGGSCQGTGGAGGGALQITAGGALRVSGSLSANGGDGAEGCDNDAGGTGAGSGGALLLEATSIDVSGATLSVKGGTGGEGQSGRSGGEGSTSAASDGGEGEEGNGSGGGGGGGGYGRVHLRAQNQCTGC